jgi:hypothetical protein
MIRGKRNKAHHGSGHGSKPGSHAGSHMAKHHDGVKSDHGGRKPEKPPKGRLQKALWGRTHPPGGRDGKKATRDVSKAREKRLEGKPL